MAAFIQRLTGMRAWMTLPRPPPRWLLSLSLSLRINLVCTYLVGGGGGGGAWRGNRVIHDKTQVVYYLVTYLGCLVCRLVIMTWDGCNVHSTRHPMRPASGQVRSVSHLASDGHHDIPLLGHLGQCYPISAGCLCLHVSRWSCGSLVWLRFSSLPTS